MGSVKRKQAKQKKRERHNAEQRKYAERVAKRRQYPKIVFGEPNAEPEFVKAVRAAVETIDFDDDTLFSPFEREFYRWIREHGPRTAFGLVNSRLLSSGMTSNEQEIGRVGLFLGFGTRILDRIPEATRRRLMPYNDVEVSYRDHDILLKFSSLLKAKGSGGTLFFSRRRPSVEFDGRKYTVAFSRHAVERICERINPRYIRIVVVERFGERVTRELVDAVKHVHQLFGAKRERMQNVVAIFGPACRNGNFRPDYDGEMMVATRRVQADVWGRSRRREAAHDATCEFAQPVGSYFFRGRF